jgi:hypothetical protein
VNFDIGEVLTRAWQITWKNKILWLLGIFLSLFVLAIFLMAFVPMFVPFLLEKQRTDLIPVTMIGWVTLFIVLLVVMYGVSVFVQTATIVGIVKANREETVFLKDILQESRRFFWRVLGLMLLYTAAVMVVNLAIQAVIFLLTIITFGLAMICLTPLTLLMYPILFGAIGWMELSASAMIVDEMTVMESIKQGWQVIRKNILVVVLVMVVVYFGIGMVSGVVMIPIMIPFFVLPISFLEHEPNWTIISIALLITAALLPIVAIINGLAMTLMRSAWVLTYLRLTRSSTNLQPVLQGATA